MSLVKLSEYEVWGLIETLSDAEKNLLFIKKEIDNIKWKENSDKFLKQEDMLATMKTLLHDRFEDED